MLLGIEKGIIDKWNKPMVYIKIVPGEKTSREDLDRMLASYGDKRLTIDTYLDKCKMIQMEGSGKVSEAVFGSFRSSGISGIESGSHSVEKSEA